MYHQKTMLYYECVNNNDYVLTFATLNQHYTNYLTSIVIS